MATPNRPAARPSPAPTANRSPAQGKAAPPKPQGKPIAAKAAARPIAPAKAGVTAKPNVASRTASTQPRTQPNPRAQPTSSRPMTAQREMELENQLGDQVPHQDERSEQMEAREFAPPDAPTNGRASQAPRAQTQSRAVAPRPAPRSAPRPQAASAKAVAIVRPSSHEIEGLTQGVRFDQLPAHMQDKVGKGTENINAEDMGIVQYKLMQALSPELTERDDLRPGDFLHTGTGENLGNSWVAVFVHYQRQYILWRPRDEGGGILARALDGKHWDPPNREFTVNLDKKDGGIPVTWVTAKTVAASGLAAWGTMNPEDPMSPPAATKMLCFLALPYQNPDMGPAILTFQRTSLKKGAQLLSKVRMVRGPMFGTAYKIDSFEDTNAAGQRFMNMRAESVGFIQDEAFSAQLESLHESFSQTGFDVRDVDSLQDENFDADAVGAEHYDNEGGDGEEPRAGAPAY